MRKKKRLCTTRSKRSTATRTLRPYFQSAKSSSRSTSTRLSNSPTRLSLKRSMHSPPCPPPLRVDTSFKCGLYEVQVKKEIVNILLFSLDMRHDSYLDRLIEMLYKLESDPTIVEKNELQLIEIIREIIEDYFPEIIDISFLMKKQITKIE